MGLASWPWLEPRMPAVSPRGVCATRVLPSGAKMKDCTEPRTCDAIQVRWAGGRRVILRVASAPSQALFQDILHRVRQGNKGEGNLVETVSIIKRRKLYISPHVRRQSHPSQKAHCRPRRSRPLLRTQWTFHSPRTHQRSLLERLCVNQIRNSENFT